MVSKGNSGRAHLPMRRYNAGTSGPGRPLAGASGQVRERRERLNRSVAVPRDWHRDRKEQRRPLDQRASHSGSRRAGRIARTRTAPREIGGFRILRRLGEGGMGIVDELSLRMFRRETETLAQLSTLTSPPSTRPAAPRAG